LGGTFDAGFEFSLANDLDWTLSGRFPKGKAYRSKFLGRQRARGAANAV